MIVLLLLAVLARSGSSGRGLCINIRLHFRGQVYQFCSGGTINLDTHVTPSIEESQGLGWKCDGYGPSAANRRERATARPTAATTEDEDATEEDNRTHARTAPAK